MREPFLKRLSLLQAGAEAAVRERVQMTVNTLVELGRLEREEAEGSHRTEWIFSGLRNFSEGTQEFFDVSAQQSLHSAGLPNRRDFEDAALRLDHVERRLNMLESAALPQSPDADGPEESVAERDASDNGAATGSS